MVDDLEIRETRSSTELWSEICSGLPSLQTQSQDVEAFTDSFQPQSEHGTEENRPNVTTCSTVLNPWAPMADSEVYIASLENRLRRLKGHAQEVTSRDMLHTLSQAKKECWDRFLHDAPLYDPFQDGSDTDPSALEHFKRWLQPEKVAINAEELEYLLHPEQKTVAEWSHADPEGTVPEHEQEEEESQTPEK